MRAFQLDRADITRPGLPPWIPLGPRQRPQGVCGGRVALHDGVPQRLQEVPLPRSGEWLYRMRQTPVCLPFCLSVSTILEINKV